MQVPLKFQTNPTWVKRLARKQRIIEIARLPIMDCRVRCEGCGERDCRGKDGDMGANSWLAES